MKVPIYQVDAFSDRVFSGNPAAVCPLDRWLPDGTMQEIAAENNLSETAFYVGRGGSYQIRWFTPKVEVDLCGHATLASAYVVLRLRETALQRVTFQSQSGPLPVTREGDLFVLDFPSRPPRPVPGDEVLTAALGRRPKELLVAADAVAVYETEEDVRTLRPDFARLAALPYFAVCVTAPGASDAHFVSRFFAPAQGIDEDPVTGRAHCELVPYWAARLGLTRLHARQVSPRGGELFCELKGDRVALGGRAALYLEGTIDV
jgi:PhzF family phenazine biosynthesis protein